MVVDIPPILTDSIEVDVRQATGSYIYVTLTARKLDNVPLATCEKRHISLIYVACRISVGLVLF